jgi:hypothetical protein
MLIFVGCNDAFIGLYADEDWRAFMFFILLTLLAYLYSLRRLLIPLYDLNSLLVDF